MRKNASTVACPTADAGKVRLGGVAPSLPTTDAGKVRPSGVSPSL
jgi:hypothetical protein